MFSRMRSFREPKLTRIQPRMRRSRVIMNGKTEIIPEGFSHGLSKSLIL